jgi:hypothetical protein
MSVREEVACFLKDFLFKLSYWGLLVRTSRTNDKNIKTILALEINNTQVKKILGELTVEDYSEGPLISFHFSEYKMNYPFKKFIE